MGFFALYQTSFNPGQPASNNLLAVSDNGPGLGLRPQITTEIVPGNRLLPGHLSGHGWRVRSAISINQISSPHTTTYSFSTHSLAGRGQPEFPDGRHWFVGHARRRGRGRRRAWQSPTRGIVYSINSANGTPTIGGSGLVTKVSVGTGNRHVHDQRHRSGAWARPTPSRAYATKRRRHLLHFPGGRHLPPTRR